MILAIDDDPEILIALRRALGSTGVPIHTTEDPEELFRILDERPVDVLLSDIDMPAMNGLEVVRRVRNSHPDVIRILLTGFGTFDAAQKAINEGEVHRFLCKPFDPRELRRIIGDAMARRQDLARMTRAGRDAERRRAVLMHLEAEHPGITKLTHDAGGVYVVNGSRAAWAERALKGTAR
jgi:DNA-binding NtrC family response regulator